VRERSLNHMAKRKRKKSEPEKARIDQVEGKTAGIVNRLTVTVDEMAGTIEFHELDPATMRLSRGYERESGKKKVLVEQPGFSTTMSLDSDQQIRRSFDYLVAVDTNTRVVHGSLVCATVCYTVPHKLAHYANEVPFVHLCSFVTVGLKPVISPENFGWHQILSKPRRADAGGRIGFVVDSALGDLPGINARTKPYYRDFLLPEGTTLIYASDAAGDTLPNQMIKLCDRVGTMLLDDLERHPEKMSNLKVGTEEFAGIAQVKPKVSH
jgi:hypothetical protein